MKKNLLKISWPFRELNDYLVETMTASLQEIQYLLSRYYLKNIKKLVGKQLYIMLEDKCIFLMTEGGEWGGTTWNELYLIKNQVRWWVWRSMLCVHLSGPQVPRLNIVSGSFWMKICISINRLGRAPSPVELGITSSLENLKGNQRWRKESFFSFSCITDGAGTSHLNFPALGLRSTWSAALVPRPSDAGWNLPPLGSVSLKNHL